MIAIGKSARHLPATKRSVRRRQDEPTRSVLCAAARHLSPYQNCVPALARGCREEAVQEAVAFAFLAYLRLVQLGKEDLVYASPLASYAVVASAVAVASAIAKTSVMSARPSVSVVKVSPWSVWISATSVAAGLRSWLKTVGRHLRTWRRQGSISASGWRGCHAATAKSSRSWRPGRNHACCPPVRHIARPCQPAAAKIVRRLATIPGGNLAWFEPIRKVTGQPKRRASLVKIPRQPACGIAAACRAGRGRL